MPLIVKLCGRDTLCPSRLAENGMYQSIITELDDSVGILTLNRAERHNTFDEQLIDELTRALLEFEADPQVRVVVLSATGKSFCAGADLHWMKRAASAPMQDNLHEARLFGRLLMTEVVWKRN